MFPVLAHPLSRPFPHEYKQQTYCPDTEHTNTNILTQADNIRVALELFLTPSSAVVVQIRPLLRPNVFVLLSSHLDGHFSLRLSVFPWSLHRQRGGDEAALIAFTHNGTFCGDMSSTEGTTVNGGAVYDSSSSNTMEVRRRNRSLRKVVQVWKSFQYLFRLYLGYTVPVGPHPNLNRGGSFVSIPRTSVSLDKAIRTETNRKKCQCQEAEESGDGWKVVLIIGPWRFCEEGTAIGPRSCHLQGNVIVA